MLLDSSHPLQLHPWSFSHDSSFYVLKCSVTFSAESVFLIICAQGNTNIQMNEFTVNLLAVNQVFGTVTCSKSAKRANKLALTLNKPKLTHLPLLLLFWFAIRFNPLLILQVSYGCFN